MINLQNKLDLSNVQGLQGIDDEAAQSLVGGAFNFGINRGNQFTSTYFEGNSGIREATRDDTTLVLGNDPANPEPGNYFTLALAEPGGDVIFDVHTAANPVPGGGVEVDDVVAGTEGDIEWRVTQVPNPNPPAPPFSPTSIIDASGFEFF